MRYWAVVVPPERWDRERLFAAASVELPGAGPEAGDQVLLVSGAGVFGLGRIRDGACAYTHRMIDEPLPADGLPLGGPGVHEVTAGVFETYAGKVGADLRVDADRRSWLVSVDLPIEAATAAEAVRQFWTFVTELGPRELPVFVAPEGDELSMQAYVLGEPAALDPEDD